MTNNQLGSVIDFLIACAHQRVDGRAAPNKACFFYECKQCGGTDRDREHLHVRPTLSGVKHKEDCLVGKFKEYIHAVVNNEKATTQANSELIAERDHIKDLMKRREGFILSMLWNTHDKQEEIETERDLLRSALNEVMNYYPTSKNAFPKYVELVERKEDDPT